MNPDLHKNTYKVLEEFLSILKCPQCKELLSNPQELVNCGHVICGECALTAEQCPECKMHTFPKEIKKNEDLSSLIASLRTLAEQIGFDLANLNVTANIKGGNTEKSKDLLHVDVEAASVTPQKISEKSLKEKEKKCIKSPLKNKGVKKPSIQVNNGRSKVGCILKGKKSLKKCSDDSSDTLDANSSVASFSSTLTDSRKSLNGNSTTRGRKGSVDKLNHKGETLLHVNCKKGNIEMVKKYLDLNANPNTKDYAGWTPLQEAASLGLYDICEILLINDAKVDTPGLDNRTALHEAVFYGHEDIVKLLLRYNANKDACDHKGHKPEFYCKSEKIAELLKNHEKNIELSDKSDFNETNMNNTLNQITDDQILLYGSNLKRESQKALRELVAKTKVKSVSNLTSKVTHVFVDVEVNKPLTWTMDILYTILQGKWLLSIDCVKVFEGITNFSEVDVSIFEVVTPGAKQVFSQARQNQQDQKPRLFRNCNFHFAMSSAKSYKYGDLEFTKEDLMSLTKAGEGDILTRQPNPSDVDTTISPYHVAHKPDHSLHKCSYYIIYVPNESPKLKYNMAHLKSLPVKWFIESICKFELLDPKEVGLQ